MYVCMCMPLCLCNATIVPFSAVGAADSFDMLLDAEASGYVCTVYMYTCV